MNKFFITGTPRSGTTIFTKTLDQQENIHLHNNGNPFYEPFHIKFLRLNPLKDLEDASKNIDCKYFGLKLFANSTIHPAELLAQGYKPIYILRKNIWKSTFSQFIQQVQSVSMKPEEFDRLSVKNNFSSKINPFTREVKDLNSDILMKMMVTLANRLVDVYQAEVVQKDKIAVIYFEDLIKQDATFDSINNYFDQKIIFNELDYVPVFPKEFIKKVTNIVCTRLGEMPKDMPSYVIENLEKYQ
jgi:hypothetical protein